jgi:serine acetyltransferase
MMSEATTAAIAWRISTRLQSIGWRSVAKCVKEIFLYFRVLLSPEVKLGDNLKIKHCGLGVVVPPNVEIGDRVSICGLQISSRSIIVASADAVFTPDVSDYSIATGMPARSRPRNLESS